MKCKRTFFVLVLLLGMIDFNFAADLPIVVVQPFTARIGVLADDAETITDIFMSELHDTNKVSVLQRVNEKVPGTRFFS